ncbi:hypothetical protein [Actinocatenispora sera]|uniref:Uncharacterized protein n=1 Tax=Actinocatenispora sera TaxID=390989 RepID=A0A810KVM8_9ACTN|nr:hypothetical protein [Actinocatenispora sera]BCJ27094.1 hypothetical protein Asera_12020 [Actinocatenispora sera]
MSGPRPAVGDLVALPRYLSDRPYRVLAVADSMIPGWVHLGGYLIRADLTQWLVDYEVPANQLRLLDDAVLPVYDSARRIK